MSTDESWESAEISRLEGLIQNLSDRVAALERAEDSGATAVVLAVGGAGEAASVETGAPDGAAAWQASSTERITLRCGVDVSYRGLGDLDLSAHQAWDRAAGNLLQRAHTPAGIQVLGKGAFSRARLGTLKLVLMRGQD